MLNNWTSYWTIFCLVLLPLMNLTSAGNYSQMLTFFSDKLSSDSYNTQVRPVMNQDDVLKVYVSFELISIVEVNDVTQSFVCNGFMLFQWIDQIFTWNRTVSGTTRMVHPVPENIWRPRVILMNTLDKRDLFDDDKAPVFINSTGTVIWAPGSLFPTSCQLDLTNYPFDVQTCNINLLAMTHGTDELRFVPMLSNVKRNFYTNNGEWDIQNGLVQVYDFDYGLVKLSTINITFVLKRRPTFFMINVLLPVVFLSFLNIFVFIIPAESGEKVGYGITVLLALAVYMNTVSGMLPRSSLTLPYVIIYLFILLILSMLTVIDSIIIVFLHNMEEKEEIHQKAKRNFRTALKKVNLLRRAVNNMSKEDESQRVQDATKNSVIQIFQSQKQENSVPSLDTADVKPGNDVTKVESAKVNKYKLIGRHINVISFIVFLMIYIAVTLGFIMRTAFA